jgi:Putative transposase/Transposase zinc-binding domain
MTCANRPRLEVADIVRAAGARYRETHATTLSRAQRRVLSAIEQCRTAALGGHVEACDRCEHQRIAYNSCRNRHCMKCQSLAKAQWLADRQADLLPVPYFHVVFTLPHELAPIAYHNQRVVYALLFRAAAETLRTIAADPKHLGAQLGFLAILHTWDQTLRYHPHLHCIVAGGGLAPDGARWIACRPGFFLPVRVLSRLFRRLFLAFLQEAFDRQQLHFFAEVTSLADSQAFAQYLTPLQQREWVVYAKAPFGGAAHVLDYLARYTHRVAISNSRLVAMTPETVTFHYRDSRHHDQRKRMTLTHEEFLRRFLLHVLPAGFQRIRHYGFLSNCHRAEQLALCRRLLGVATPTVPAMVARLDYRTQYEQVTGYSLERCPACGQGQMRLVSILARCVLRLQPQPQDTS